MKQLLMTLRFEGVKVLFGIVFGLIGWYGLSIRRLPDDLPYTTPIPYDVVFWISICLGVVLLLWAHAKAPKAG